MGRHKGDDTWAWQEKSKGQMVGNYILSSNHGGWRFNDNAYGTNYFYSETPVHMSPAAAAALPDSELKTNAFFDFSSSQLGTDPIDPFTLTLPCKVPVAAHTHRPTAIVSCLMRFPALPCRWVQIRCQDCNHQRVLFK